MGVKKYIVVNRIIYIFEIRTNGKALFLNYFNY